MDISDDFFETDVLVIGAGGAGLRAAIEAHDAGVDVIVLGKTLSGKAHTVMAEGGINAPLGSIDPKDNWKVHALDTIKEGIFLSNPDMVETLTRNAESTILELENYGLIFDRTPEGKISQRAFGAQTYRRTCHIQDRTGLDIMHALMDEVRRRDMHHMEEVFITDLITTGARVAGAVGFDMKTGKVYVFSAKAVILATGGYARAFKRTTNAWENNGDGIAMAYQVGAALMDMEMVQFHPTGMVYPPSAVGILVTEGVRGEGGILRNSKGDRFMKTYDPERMDLSARDIVARANFTEIHQGRGTEHGGVYLDLTHLERDFILKKLPKMYDNFKKFTGIDITKEMMEVAPSAHYTMGGVKVADGSGHSTVNGLFAVGEVGSGVHGANRLGGNSLLGILVFGKKCGSAASDYVKKAKKQRMDQKKIDQKLQSIVKPFESKVGVTPTELKKDISGLMWEKVGIMRNANGMNDALKQLIAIKNKASKMSVDGTMKFNRELMNSIDIKNLLPVCEATIRSALFREESRGAHYRNDFPKTLKKWEVNIVCKKGARGMALSKVQVPKPKSLMKEVVKNARS